MYIKQGIKYSGTQTYTGDGYEMIATTVDATNTRYDITLVTSARDPLQAKDAMDAALDQLLQYAHSNRLSPAPEKTQLMFCASNTKRLATLGQLACVMGEQQIRPSATIKVLGVLLDMQR